METRCPVAGQAGAPMVAGPLAGQSLGGMEAPMAPVARQRSAAWKQNRPSRRRLADRWCEMARPRRKPRRCGPAGYCQCPRDRNNRVDRSGVCVQRCGWRFLSPLGHPGRYDPHSALLQAKMARSRGGLGVMETRWPVAGQAGSPIVAGPLAGQSLGGMAAPMAPVAGQRSAAWKRNRPSRRGWPTDGTRWLGRGASLGGVARGLLPVPTGS